MKSKTSFIDTGILLNDLKRHAWIGAGYLLGMLLALPLMLVMTHSSIEPTASYDPYVYLRILQFNSVLQLALLVLVPILTGLWLFHYLQDDRAADMIHTLPVRRETLYNTHILAGIILLTLPLGITALITWGTTAGMAFPHVNGGDVLAWLCVALLFSLVFFITSVCVGMFTGISTLQGILTIILLLLPMGLYWLLLSNYNMYTYGFAYDFYFDEINYSPLARLNSISGLTGTEILVYLLAVGFLYFVGRYLYRKRRLEYAGSAIAFDGLQPVFKYGVVFCCTLLLGSYFHNWQNYSMEWTYFGYLLGSLLAYVLVEMLLTKSINVFHWQAARGYIIYAVSMVLLITALHVDLSGYEKRIPAIADVDSIYYAEIASSRHNQSRSGVIFREVPDQNQNPQPYTSLPDPVFKEPGDVEAIMALHQQIINNRAQASTGTELKRMLFEDDTRRVFLAYNLKNGRHLYRQYVIDGSQYGPVLKPVMESRTYKLAHSPVLHVDPQLVKFVEIRATGVSRSVRLADEKMIAEAVMALQTDVNNRTYEDIMSNKPGWANISIFLSDNRQVEVQWAPSFTHFEAWLKQNGQYEKARLMPDDIQYVLVVKGSAGDDWTKKVSSNQQYVLEMEKRPDCLKITDPSGIEACLRSYYNPNKQTYWAAFVLKDGNSMLAGFKPEDAPELVKRHFDS
jgi:ABC-2 type transport system permease protein